MVRFLPPLFRGTLSETRHRSLGSFDAAQVTGLLPSTMAMHLMMLAAATAYQAVQPPALAVRGRVPMVRAVVTAPTIEPVLSPPKSKKEMLTQAVSCIKRAKEDGNNRYILRLFLPRGPEETLIPCDESW